MLLIITMIMMIMRVAREHPRIVIMIMPVMMMIMTMEITMIMMIYMMIIIMVIALMIMTIIRVVEEKTLVWNLPTVLEAPGVSFDKIVINARNDQVYDHIILTRGGC